MCKLRVWSIVYFAHCVTFKYCLEKVTGGEAGKQTDWYFLMYFGRLKDTSNGTIVPTKVLT